MNDAINNSGLLSAEELQKRLQPTPPATPEEFAQRKQGWLANFQKFLNAPETKAMMLQTGIDLLRPIQPGQTRGTNIANALQSGAQAAEKVKAAQAKAVQNKAENEIKASDAVSRRITALAEKGKAGAQAAAKVQLIDHVTDTIMSLNPKMTRAEARAVATDRVVADPVMKTVMETVTNNIAYVTSDDPKERKRIFDAAVEAAGATPSTWSTAVKAAQEKREAKDTGKKTIKPVGKKTGTDTDSAIDGVYIPGVGFRRKEK